MGEARKTWRWVVDDDRYWDIMYDNACKGATKFTWHLYGCDGNCRYFHSHYVSPEEAIKAAAHAEHHMYSTGVKIVDLEEL
jgi:hypothetical protein